jgi:hypothetical protein
MNGASLLVLGLGVAVAVTLLATYLRLTSGVRMRRRLRRTHDPIVSKARQPSIQLSVKTPKE